MADPTLLERALLNLLDNAAKYAPQGGNIDVSLSATTGSVVIEVSDEGPGLDPSDLPHIFDKFYRSQRAADRPGSGLGLAIVRGLVERMGGSVTAGNRIGARGATFTIRLEAVPERSLAQL
jgi:two-component system sensor histidine kinase KdpD